MTAAEASSALSGRSGPARYEAFAYPALEAVRLDLRLCAVLTFPEFERDLGATLLEIRAAAYRVFLACQRELAIRGEGFRPAFGAERTDLFKIRQAMRLAIRAGSLTDGAVRPGNAKRLQLEATKDSPLTVCIGELYRDGLAGSLRGDGCGVVFRDSTSISRFASYCPKCRERKFARELDARRRARLHGRQAVPLPDGSYLYFGKCWCGQAFKTDDVRQTRCWPHHVGHGAPPPPKAHFCRISKACVRRVPPFAYARDAGTAPSHGSRARRRTPRPPGFDLRPHSDW